MPENQSLKAARKRRHWTQTQVAEKCGVDLQTYYRWEHGIQEPHGYNIGRLCEIFNQPMEQLGYAYLIEVKEAEGTAATPEDRNGSLVRLTSEQITMLLPLIGDSTVDLKKRNTLRTILTTAGVVVTTPLTLVNSEPWERLATTKPTAINQDTIQHFNGLLNTSRALSNGSELGVARNLLDTFLPRLQEAAPYQPEVAGLTSQALLLKSIFAAHDLQVGDKIALCQAAVKQAKISTNPNLIATGLLQLGVAYHYAQQDNQALQAQQEALSYVNQVSSLVASHVYTELASSLAQFGRVREAGFYIDFAYETFPQHPEQDPNFAIDDHWLCNLGLYKGIMYMHLAQPKAAWEAFEEHRKLTDTPERIRLEIINNQGKAALLAKDLDKYSACLKDGLDGAIILRSKKRFNEALTIFQEVPQSWPKEPQLRSIIEQYAL